MISEPRIVPSARSTLLILALIFVFSPVSSACLNFFKNTFSSIVLDNLKSYASFGLYKCFLSFANGLSIIADKSSFFVLSSSWMSSRTFNKSVRPINSSSCLTPSFAISSRTSSAIKHMKFSTYSGFPLNRFLSSGFWVATPTGQVSRLHTRIITHPIVTSGAVAKPYSSAPSNAATITSRPVISLPSVSITTFERSPFIISVWCVSARPSSQGSPALWIELAGAAPVPPS